MDNSSLFPDIPVLPNGHMDRMATVTGMEAIQSFNNVNIYLQY